MLRIKPQHVWVTHQTHTPSLISIINTWLLSFSIGIYSTCRFCIPVLLPVYMYVYLQVVSRIPFYKCLPDSKACHPFLSVLFRFTVQNMWGFNISELFSGLTGITNWIPWKEKKIGKQNNEHTCTWKNTLYMLTVSRDCRICADMIKYRNVRL